MSTDPKTIQSYNDFAQAYTDHRAVDKNSPYHSYYEKPAIQAEVPDITGKTVISIGCGPGIDTEWLRNRGASRAVGIDISEKLIDIAKNRYPECEFHVMDMEQLDFPDASFDFAYSSLALHYVSDWDKVFGDVHRILKPESSFIFSCGHPIDSALERVNLSESANEKKLGRLSDKATGEFVVYGDYLAAKDNGVHHFRGELEHGMTIGIFHRPISKMVESINESGLTIRKLIEPLPSADMANKDPKHYDYLRRIPAFVIWVLDKS